MVNVGIFSFIHFVKSNIKLKQNTEFKNLSIVNEAQMVFFLTILFMITIKVDMISHESFCIKKKQFLTLTLFVNKYTFQTNKSLPRLLTFKFS